MPAGPSHYSDAYIEARGWVRRLIHTNWRSHGVAVGTWMTGTTNVTPASPYVRSVAPQTGGHGITHRLRDMAVGWPIVRLAPSGVPAVLYYVRYSCGAHTYFPQLVTEQKFSLMGFEDVCRRCFSCRHHHKYPA